MLALGNLFRNCRGGSRTAETQHGPACNKQDGLLLILMFINCNLHVLGSGSVGLAVGRSLHTGKIASSSLARSRCFLLLILIFACLDSQIDRGVSV